MEVPSCPRSFKLSGVGSAYSADQALMSAARASNWTAAGASH